MFKKIVIFLMLAVLMLGMVACGSSGTQTDVQEEQEAADYEKFIKDYASKGVLKNYLEVKGDTAEEKAADYIASYEISLDNKSLSEDAYKLYEDVLELYAESFNGFFADSSVDDKGWEEKAKDMLVREMAVYEAYRQLKGEAIDTNDRDAMNNAAEAMAEKYGYKAEDIYTEGGSTYLVETYIKYEYIVNWFSDLTETSK